MIESDRLSVLFIYTNPPIRWMGNEFLSLYDHYPNEDQKNQLVNDLGGRQEMTEPA